MHAEAIHFLVDPVTSVLFAIGPTVSTKALDKAFFVRSGVCLTIRPLLNTISITLVRLVVSKELSAIRICFFAGAFHDSFTEHAVVDEEVHVSGDTLSVVHVIRPLSFI